MWDLSKESVAAWGGELSGSGDEGCGEAKERGQQEIGKSVAWSCKEWGKWERVQIYLHLWTGDTWGSRWWAGHEPLIYVFSRGCAIFY